MSHPLLSRIDSPADVKRLSRAELKQLAVELRDYLLQNVARTGGHLSSNLGTLTGWYGTWATRPTRTRS